jgi:antitoxin HicB
MKRTRQPPIVSLRYPVRLDPEPDGGFIVSFPDFFFRAPDGQELSGGYSFGATREEALARAGDLLATILANHLAEGLPVPTPAPTAPDDPQRPLIGVDLLTAAKLELYRALHDVGISKADLARRLGIAPQQVHRLFDLDHASRIDQLDAALRALGRRLVITSEAA